MRKIRFLRTVLINFKIHPFLDFDFSQNRLITVVGNNGSGKSTIFDALLWSLTEETTKGLTGDTVVTKVAEKNTLVMTMWEDDNDTYVSVTARKHKKYKNLKMLFKNPKTILGEITDFDLEDQVKTVEKYVATLPKISKEITGETKKETLAMVSNLLMPKEVLKNCLLFCNLTKKKSFSDMTHSEQKDVLDKMLLLDKYDVYHEKFSKAEKEEKEKLLKEEAKIEPVSTLIREYESNIEYEKDKFERESLASTEAYSQTSDTLKELEDKIPALEKEIETFKSLDEELQEHILNCRYKTSERDKTKETCGEEIIKMKDQAQIKKSEVESKINKEESAKSDSIRESLLIVSKSRESASNSYYNASSKISSEKIEKLEPLNVSEEKSDLVSAIAELDIEIRDLISDGTSENREYKRIKSELDKVNSNLDKDTPICDSCGQEIKDEQSLDRKKKESIKLEKDKEKLEKKLRSIKKKIENKKTLKTTHEEEVAKIVEDIDNKKKIIEEEFEDKSRQINEAYDKTLEELESKTTTLTEQLSDFQKERDRRLSILEEKFTTKTKELENKIKEKYKDVFYQLKEEVETIELSIQLIKEKLQTRDEKTSQLQQTQNNIIHHKTILSSHVQELERVNINFLSQIKMLKEKIATNQSKEDSLRENLTTINKKLEIISFWKKGFSDIGIKNILLDESIPILKEKAKELSNLTNHIRVDFNSQTQTSAGDVRNKFELVALHTENLSELKEMSEGETRMVNIIVMLCLRNLLEKMQDVNINIILLDEILDSLDPDNALIAVHMIRKLSQNHCVVLISHTLRDYIESDMTIQF